MQKIAVLLIALSIVGFTKTQVLQIVPSISVSIGGETVPDCTYKLKHLHIHQCCYNISTNITPFDTAVESCFVDHKDDPDPEICASGCGLVKTGTGDMDGHMNYTALHDVLASQLINPLIVDHMMNTFQDCEKQVTEIMKKTKYIKETGPCTSRAKLLLRCTVDQGLRNCPAGIYQKGDYCQKILEDTLSCAYE